MIAELTLPRLGETMETGRVVAWLKQPGERFRRGETLVEIESDKTVVEMPALADGTLVEIVAALGTDVEVGAVICRYEGAAPAGAAAVPASPPVAEPSPAAPPPTAAVVAAPVGARQRATPLARSVARRQHVALDAVIGTGPRGRIEARDVRAAATTDRMMAAGIAYRMWQPATPGGDTLVLLHGFAAEAQSWAVLAAALARRGHRVIAPDLPGHGATDLPGEHLAGLVDSITGFLRAGGFAPVHLVGHSLGGAVSARIARAEPGLVSRLTLLAPAGLDRGIDAGFIHDIAHVSAGGALAHLLRRLAVRPQRLSAAQLDAMAAELARGRLIALADALCDATGQQIDITADLRELAVPVRIIWGLADRIIPWTQAAQAGGRVGVYLVPDAGHVPHWDQPEEIAALLD